jgi:hypothetical protein
MLCAYVMKPFSIFLIVVAGLSIALPLRAQTAAQATQSKIPEATDYAIANQDVSSRVWERTVYEPDAAGKVVPQKHSYTELGTGLNYQDEQGQWQPSVASFRAVKNLFVADKVPTKVILADNLNTSNAVTTITADGVVLNSTPVAIALYDAASGTSLVIGVITNCAGVLVNSNQVAYENAFSGVCADVYYTIKRGTFDQDVVLVGRLNPEDYGFPAATTRIQILTEFYQAARPEKIRRPLYVEKDQAVRSRMATPDVMDETLGFGQSVFGHGQAYTAVTHGEGTPVGKEYKTLSGRSFLVETVRYPAIQKELEALPDCTGSTASARLQLHLKSAEAYAAIPEPGLNGSVATAKTPKSLPLLALNQCMGFVIDYTYILGSLTDNIMLRGDTTYFIDAPAYIEGSLTIEGGAVIKYANNNGGSGPCFIQVDNALVCNTSAYRPAIFTTAIDDTVGEYVDSGRIAGINHDAVPELLLNNLNLGNQTISHLRFRYAQTAVKVANIPNYVNLYCTVNDSQFLNCLEGIHVLTGGCGTTVSMNNCLMANIQSPIVFNGEVEGIDLTCYSCTIANVNQFISVGDGGYVNAIYSGTIFANVTNWYEGDVYISSAVDNGFYNSPQDGFSQHIALSYPFQTVGAASYYLTDDSGFHGILSSPYYFGIDPASSAEFQAELQQGTTYPPLVYSNIVISGTTNFSPQVPRDTDIQDLGYHYNSLDYIVDKLTVTNAALTISGGTVIASYNEPGIQLKKGSSLVSVGTPLSPNWFVRYQSVQEQPVALGGTSVTAGQTISTAGLPSAWFQFSKFAVPAFGGSHILDTVTNAYTNLVVQNCEFWSGQNDFTGSTNTSAIIANNLFYRSPVNAAATNLSSTLAFSNNLVLGTTATFRQPTNSVWYAFNNDFDSTTITTNSVLTNGYNAYLHYSGRLYPTNSHDVLSTNTLAYQTGFLGTFYQPAGSLLVDKGSTTANLVGLYHFTTQTNQVPETNSIVDIGYHYVATDGSGNPLDTDGDGLPDYLEDSNGNGIFDTGDLGNWLIGLYNGLSPTAGLQVFTPLK